MPIEKSDSGNEYLVLRDSSGKERAAIVLGKSSTAILLNDESGSGIDIVASQSSYVQFKRKDGTRTMQISENGGEVVVGVYGLDGKHVARVVIDATSNEVRLDLFKHGDKSISHSW